MQEQLDLHVGAHLQSREPRLGTAHPPDLYSGVHVVVDVVVLQHTVTVVIEVDPPPVGNNTTARQC